MGDGLDGGEIAVGGNGKAGLEDIDAKVGEGMGHLELLMLRHAAAGGLLAIAERCIKKMNKIVPHLHHLKITACLT